MKSIKKIIYLGALLGFVSLQAMNQGPYTTYLTAKKSRISMSITAHEMPDVFSRFDHAAYRPMQVHRLSSGQIVHEIYKDQFGNTWGIRYTKHGYAAINPKTETTLHADSIKYIQQLIFESALDADSRTLRTELITQKATLGPKKLKALGAFEKKCEAVTDIPQLEATESMVLHEIKKMGKGVTRNAALAQDSHREVIKKIKEENESWFPRKIRQVRAKKELDLEMQKRKCADFKEAELFEQRKLDIIRNKLKQLKQIKSTTTVDTKSSQSTHGQKIQTIEDFKQTYAHANPQALYLVDVQLKRDLKAVSQKIQGLEILQEPISAKQQAQLHDLEQRLAFINEKIFSTETRTQYESLRDDLIKLQRTEGLSTQQENYLYALAQTLKENGALHQFNGVLTDPAKTMLQEYGVAQPSEQIFANTLDGRIYQENIERINHIASLQYQHPENLLLDLHAQCATHLTGTVLSEIEQNSTPITLAFSHTADILAEQAHALGAGDSTFINGDLRILAQELDAAMHDVYINAARMAKITQAAVNGAVDGTKEMVLHPIETALDIASASVKTAEAILKGCLVGLLRPPSSGEFNRAIVDLMLYGDDTQAIKAEQQMRTVTQDFVDEVQLQTKNLIEQWQHTSIEDKVYAFSKIATKIAITHKVTCLTRSGIGRAKQSLIARKATALAKAETSLAQAAGTEIKSAKLPKVDKGKAPMSPRPGAAKKATTEAESLAIRKTPRAICEVDQFQIEPSSHWCMPEKPCIIHGRKYTQHALERMAPDTLAVRAELASRAKKLGLEPGSLKFKKFIQPRGITPSVVENCIKNGIAEIGKEPGTIFYKFENIVVVTNKSGDVITTMISKG